MPPSPTARAPNAEKTHTRADMARYLSAELGLNQQEARQFVGTFFEELVRCLEQGGTASLPGLGKFAAVARRERLGRNPSTGEPYTIPARRAVRFVPAGLLRQRLRQPEAEDPGTGESK